ncbi:Uncharacterized protein TCM_032027 [Theobroma cacao]|uniref:Retrotransposon Copia-like N-terminal domain-containing protein n=1 Tax=Theobroma cacao TaxID=3641 RepID=A0A061F9Q1_THECC|nr:Uncharacterized protein TCM_032027 [Theobroma cacao]
MSKSTNLRPQMSQTSIDSRSPISLIADPQSPYFLHHTDHPRSVVINPKLTTNNYVVWSRSFLLVLSIRNKIGFMNGTIPKLDATKPIFPSWTRCNNLLVAWLLDSITQPIASIVFYVESTMEIWNTFKQNFA